MSFSLILSMALATLSLPTCLAYPIATRAAGIKIVLGNDDGWAEANIRQFYTDLVAYQYDVILSAGAFNGSGTGSTDLPASPLTFKNAEYDSVIAPAPAQGQDPNNSRLNYVNSFPVTAVKYGLNERASVVWGEGAKPDLVLAGPNVGANLGPVTLISGTVGVATEGVNQGIPSIAFSGGDGGFRPYTAIQPGDISHVYSELALKITDQVVASGKPYLPAGTSLNVNFPVTSATCTSAREFKFVFSTIYPQILPFIPVSKCTDGTATPAESDVIAAGCTVSISVMNGKKLDVDADTQGAVFTKLKPLLTCMSGTKA